MGANEIVKMSRSIPGKGERNFREYRGAGQKSRGLVGRYLRERGKKARPLIFTMARVRVRGAPCSGGRVRDRINSARSCGRKGLAHVASAVLRILRRGCAYILRRLLARHAEVDIKESGDRNIVASFAVRRAQL